MNQASRTIEGCVVLKTYNIDNDKFKGTIDIWKKDYPSGTEFNFSIEGEKSYTFLGKPPVLWKPYYVDVHRKSYDFNIVIEYAKIVCKERLNFELEDDMGTV